MKNLYKLYIQKAEELKSTKNCSKRKKLLSELNGIQHKIDHRILEGAIND
jgi:hypothetical protein